MSSHTTKAPPAGNPVIIVALHVATQRPARQPAGRSTPPLCRREFHGLSPETYHWAGLGWDRHLKFHEGRDNPRQAGTNASHSQDCDAKLPLTQRFVTCSEGTL
jgi:hypothetical protein